MYIKNKNSSCILRLNNNYFRQTANLLVVNVYLYYILVLRYTRCKFVYKKNILKVAKHIAVSHIVIPIGGINQFIIYNCVFCINCH